MKSVVLSKSAAASLLRHGRKAQAALRKIDAYAQNPAAGANNVEALKGSKASRLRAGGWRVIFVESASEILVLDIGPRGGIYG